MAKDRSREQVTGKAWAKAFRNCVNCQHTETCHTNQWVITCDKDGVTCDNYEAAAEVAE